MWFLVIPPLLALSALFVYAGEQSHDYPPMIALLTVVGALLAFFCTRLARMSVRFDDAGVTVRNFWRTHRIGWHEVSSITDGTFCGDWAVRVVRRDGRTVTAASTGMQYDRRTMPTTKDVLSAIAYVAERYSVRAEVTGWTPQAKAIMSRRLNTDPGASGDSRSSFEPR
jgi:hypothetical protein